MYELRLVDQWITVNEQPYSRAATCFFTERRGLDCQNLTSEELGQRRQQEQPLSSGRTYYKSSLIFQSFIQFQLKIYRDSYTIPTAFGM
jgi:hypothetical protein